MKKIAVFIIFFIFQINVFSQNPKYPFPKHETYTVDHIKPSLYTQEELDNITTGFYTKWKAKYLKNSCGAGQYFVSFSDGKTCVSEGQGYGMMIIPLMAGYDANAKVYFNGLYKYYKSHPSSINPNLMAWKQINCVDDPDSGNDAASDGDIDIAYGLLLAHVQWGSAGDINYLQEAKNIIKAIMDDEINPQTWTVKLGDWATSSSSKYYYSTRTSDFILDHFRTFKCANNNNNWDKVVEKCYSLINEMQENYSPQTGLLPDFIINVNTTAKPAAANFLEGDNDGNYYYNACRDPWRLATDYLLFGDERAKTAVNKINTWLMNKCSNDPDNIKSGYKLDGTEVANWDDASFVGPFTVGAMLDDTNQQWLDDLFDKLLAYNFNSGDYYSNTITMLNLLVISGNYWSLNCDELITAIEQIQNKNELNFFIEGDILYFQSDMFLNNAFIYDLNGKLLRKSVVNRFEKEIDISGLAKSCYILKLTDKTSNYFVSKKFVIKN